MGKDVVLIIYIYLLKFLCFCDRQNPTSLFCCNLLYTLVSFRHRTQEKVFSVIKISLIHKLIFVVLNNLNIFRLLVFIELALDEIITVIT